MNKLQNESMTAKITNLKAQVKALKVEIELLKENENETKSTGLTATVSETIFDGRTAIQILVSHGDETPDIESVYVLDRINGQVMRTFVEKLKILKLLGFEIKYE